VSSESEIERGEAEHGYGTVLLHGSSNTTSFLRFFFFKITHNFIFKLEKLTILKLFKIMRTTTFIFGPKPNS
jgi:hypothetical protein